MSKKNKKSTRVKQHTFDLKREKDEQEKKEKKQKSKVKNGAAGIKVSKKSFKIGRKSKRGNVGVSSSLKNVAMEL